MPKSSLHRALIVGCGNIAGGFDLSRTKTQLPLTHAGAYIKHGAFEIRACIDPDADRLYDFSQRWNVSLKARDFAELKANPGDFDVISICSPTTLHEFHLVEALRLKPKVIFCEKPLTSEASSCARLVASCREQGVTLAVNFSRNWDPSVEELVHDIRLGRWGSVRSVVAHYNKGISNNGSHMLELLYRLIGPLDLLETTNPVYDYWPDDPTVGVLLTGLNGEVSIFLNPSDARDYAFFELELVCELGVIRMQSGGLVWQARDVTDSEQFVGYKGLNPEKKTDGRYMEAMLGAVENIDQHLRNGEVIRCTGENALEIQSLCQKIKFMAQERKEFKTRGIA